MVFFLKQALLGLFLLSLGACGSGSDPKGVNFPSRSGDFLDVYQAYGPAVVYPGEFDAEADHKPWVGYWLPTADSSIFEGSESVLQKYDAVSRAMGTPAQSAKYQKDKIYRLRSDAVWDGSCYAWALASMMEREPKKSVTLHGVTFSPDELKVLLTKIYEDQTNVLKFGQRFDGKRGDVHEDIYPEQFHRFVQAELFEKRRPFAIDKDPDIAVWETPIFMAVMRIEKTSDPHRFKVWTELLSVEPQQTLDDKRKKHIAYQYHYILEGYPREDGGLDVVRGEWAFEPKWAPKDSRTDHPDFVTAISDNLVYSSMNREIKNEVVRALVEKSY